MATTSTMWLLVLMLFRASTSLRVQQQGVARLLGGYERLLSRLTPGTNQLSLSHASAVILDNEVDHNLLISSVSKVMEKHPMLRSYISRQDGQSESWMYCDKPSLDLAADVVSTKVIQDAVLFDSTWQSLMEAGLNNAEFRPEGPLWRLTNVVCPELNTAAWIFCVNHGADDQGSINLVVNDLVCVYNCLKNSEDDGGIGEPKPFPPSMEDAMVQGAQFPLPSTLGWSLFQMCNSLQRPAMLPRHILAGAKKSEPAYLDPNNRETFCEYVDFSEEIVTRLRKRCRERGITVTSALSAAMLSITSHAIQTLGDAREPLTDQKLRFLLSVDLRPYGSEGREDWTAGTVACAAGAVDYVVPVTKSVSASAVGTQEQGSSLDDVWMLAARCQQRSDDIINKKRWVPDSVRLFGFGMRYAQILPLVEQDARSEATLGRGFSCGVSNMGLARFNSGAAAGAAGAAGAEGSLLGVKRVHYGTSHARNGVLCQLSCMSVAAPGASGAPFFGTLQFTRPLVGKQEAADMRARLKGLVEAMSCD